MLVERHKLIDALAQHNYMKFIVSILQVKILGHRSSTQEEW